MHRGRWCRGGCNENGASLSFTVPMNKAQKCRFSELCPLEVFFGNHSPTQTFDKRIICSEVLGNWYVAACQRLTWIKLGPVSAKALVNASASSSAVFTAQAGTPNPWLIFTQSVRGWPRSIKERACFPGNRDSARLNSASRIL